MNNRKRAYNKALKEGFIKEYSEKILNNIATLTAIFMNKCVYFVLNKKPKFVYEAPKFEMDMGREIYHRYFTLIHLHIMNHVPNFIKNMKVYYNIENQTLTCEWMGTYEEYWYKCHSKCSS